MSSPGLEEHSIPDHVDSSTDFNTPEKALNAPVSSSTVGPATVRRVGGIDDLRAA